MTKSVLGGGGGVWNSQILVVGISCTMLQQPIACQLLVNCLSTLPCCGSISTVQHLVLSLLATKIFIWHDGIGKVVWW